MKNDFYFINEQISSKNSSLLKNLSKVNEIILSKSIQLTYQYNIKKKF